MRYISTHETLKQSSIQFLNDPSPNCPGGGGGGGVLPKKWCTGMLKGFKVHFYRFWYTNGVVFKLFRVY